MSLSPRGTATTGTLERRVKKRAKPLIRSAGIRLALVYATVFGVSAFALAFSLWYSTLGLLERQVEFTIHNDTTALEEHYALGGLPSLITAIENRLAISPKGDAIYLLQDSHGKIIIGNLDFRPAGISQVGGWYELPVTRQGAGSTALVRADILSNGDKLLVGRDDRAREQLRGILQQGLLSAMGLMALLGLVGAIVIRTLFRRMIRDIAATTRAISRGDLTRRVPKTGDGDEFDELAEIINDMLDRITRLMDGVREVSNSIAHDLRTPITRARTRLEDAAIHAGSADDLRTAIERATGDLDGVVAVFQALLRIAEIEAGARRAAFAMLDLTPLLLDIEDLYLAVAEDRGIALRAEIESPLKLLGDRELIQQAVTNLLENALKFSPAGAAISFRAGLRDGTIEITIADNGPGISEEDRIRATERFFRAESARSTTGSGLGLALVAAVAHLHNGVLSLTDNLPGLRAIILLPQTPDLPAD